MNMDNNITSKHRRGPSIRQSNNVGNGVDSPTNNTRISSNTQQRQEGAVQAIKIANDANSYLDGSLNEVDSGNGVRQ